MEEKSNVYSVSSNVFYLWKKVGEINKKYYAISFFYFLLSVIVPFIITILPGYIISLLEAKKSMQSIIIVIVILLVFILLSNAILKILTTKVRWMNHLLLQGKLRYELNEKLLTCDYENLEREETRKHVQASSAAINMFSVSSEHTVLHMFLIFISNIFGFLLYSFIVSTLQIWILVLLITITYLNFKIQVIVRNYEFKQMDEFWKNSDQHWYLRKECVEIKKAKDIRLYQMQQWFNKRYEKNMDEAITIYNDITRKIAYGNISIRITSLIRDVIVYGYLIYLLMNHSLSIGMFVIYVGVVLGFSTWLLEIVRSYTELKKNNMYVDKFRTLLEMKDESYIGVGEHLKKQPHDIVFDDISFGYENQSLLFDHFSLRIAPKEKIALVGINGAGKTTLMKLLCHLYPLQSGEIKVDGIDISKISRDEYFKEISIVFQEINEFALSIARFVSCAPTKEDDFISDDEIEKVGTRVSESTEKVEYHEDNVIAVLKQAGLWEKIESLPKGIHTNLTKFIDRDGMLLSGGEMQKLMLARALYKNSNILILDEPTAALDPIAESEMYENYACLCKDKTSIFISHRLSSTKFCDRIIFLENGKIIESGTHDELMKKEGKYAEMFAIQSRYYQEEL